ncbi:heavy-metal-associated domain-containing protein [Frigidibacter sp. SD6-1]|uniref:heavy-metal-associated domain-containing protein n=1 Tax=Frigidibacter sp. SD6-1 TaxID=3032581 RepID=UPI0024DFE0B4|nr:heavy-metal-associated domain-containing protein [Frigidibacter sp. SD6-1]
MKLSIPDMSCGHCRATVEKTIAALDPTAKVAVDLGSRTALVTSGAPAEAVLAALKAEGYPASPAD